MLDDNNILYKQRFSRWYLIIQMVLVQFYFSTFYLASSLYYYYNVLYLVLELFYIAVILSVLHSYSCLKAVEINQKGAIVPLPAAVSGEGSIELVIFVLREEK